MEHIIIGSLQAVMLKKGWKRTGRKKVFVARDGRTVYMELFQDTVRTPKGKTLSYTHYRSSDVVIIVPFLDSKRLVMIKQYRYPLDKVMLEFPAGHVEKGESPLATAKRELREETGYTAKKIERIYTYHPSVSKSRQLVHVFRAAGLAKGKISHDSTEDISVKTVTTNDLRSMIAGKKVENAGTLIAYLLCCTGIKINRRKR
jgi:ADP-ribose pyrophosphatase